LGIAFAKKGRLTDAIARFRKILESDPDNVEACDKLAWLLATASDSSMRNGVTAVALAQHAAQLTGGSNPMILRTLAAACAEAGRFSEAVETAQNALHLAVAQTDATLAGQLQFELELYQSGRPFKLPEQKH
jgi:Flp pilus assembly protein TadD